jgi:hypothetical protein
LDLEHEFIILQWSTTLQAQFLQRQRVGQAERSRDQASTTFMGLANVQVALAQLDMHKLQQSNKHLRNTRPSSNDLMGQTWQPSLAFKEQQLCGIGCCPPRRMASSWFCTRGLPQFRFFRQDFIKHLGDSERQILVLLNDPWVARRRMKMLG